MLASPQPLNYMIWFQAALGCFLQAIAQEDLILEDITYQRSSAPSRHAAIFTSLEYQQALGYLLHSGQPLTSAYTCPTNERHTLPSLTGSQIPFNMNLISQLLHRRHPPSNVGEHTQEPGKSPYGFTTRTLAYYYRLITFHH